MAKKRHDRVAEVIKEIEAMAKRLRADVRRAARESGLTRNLERAAVALRKQAAKVALQVEKYAHELRLELARTPARKSMKRRAA